MEATALNPDLQWIEAFPRVSHTSLTVLELIDYIVTHRETQDLFRKFPELQPDDLRDAVEYAARNGYLA